jgi:thiol-disulfide isomerase/thioredoxin
MNWKKNPNLMIGLCIALGLALVIIVYMMLPKSSNGGGDSGAESLMPPPQRQPQPRPPPPAMRPPSPQQQMAPPPSERQTHVGGSGLPALVLFHANWCGACKHAMPSWEQARDTLQKTASGQIEVISIEQTANPEATQANDIKGFPTIRFYPHGFGQPQTFAEYNGNRTVESLLNFARSGGQSS